MNQTRRGITQGNAEEREEEKKPRGDGREVNLTDTLRWIDLSALLLNILYEKSA